MSDSSSGGKFTSGTPSGAAASAGLEEWPVTRAEVARPEEVDAWHQAGVAAGGTPIEDPPGVRSNAFGALYLAYLRDPDGNKLCGLHRPAQ